MTISLGIGASRVADNYADLQTLIAAYLNRSDLDDRIPTFIELFERQANRTLITPDREYSVSAPITGAYTLPSDFWQLRTAYLDTDPRVLLEQVTPSELRATYPSQTTGKPQVFAISAGQMLFGPAPDDTYQLVLTYYRSIDLLGPDVSSNWLLEDHPDIYLYGSLLQAMAFLKNDNRIVLWKAAMDEALDQLMQAGLRKRYSGSPLRLRHGVSGG